MRILSPSIITIVAAVGFLFPAAAFAEKLEGPAERQTQRLPTVQP